jgi:hypothetical protein
LKVRMVRKLSGTRDGQDWPAVGDTIDVPDDEGATLISQGNAEGVKKGAPEKAVTADEPETATGSGPYEERTKAQLLSLAKSRGLDVTNADSKADIIDALRA